MKKKLYSAILASIMVIGSICGVAIPVYAKEETKIIDGNDSLSEELAHGTLEEVLSGLTAAYSLIDVKNFTMLLGLAKNVANLTAKQRL